MTASGTPTGTPRPGLPAEVLAHGDPDAESRWPALPLPGRRGVAVTIALVLLAGAGAVAQWAAHRDTATALPTFAVAAAGTVEDVVVSGPDEDGGGAPVQARVRLIVRNTGTVPGRVAAALLAGPDLSTGVILSAPSGPVAGVDLPPGGEQRLTLTSRVGCTPATRPPDGYRVEVLAATTGARLWRADTALPPAAARALADAIDELCAQLVAPGQLRRSLIDVSTDPAAATLAETWRVANGARVPVRVSAGGPAYRSGGVSQPSSARSWVGGGSVVSGAGAHVLAPGAVADLRVVVRVDGCWELRRSAVEDASFSVTALPPRSAWDAGLPPPAAAAVTPARYEAAVRAVCPDDGVAVVGERGSASYDERAGRVVLRFPVTVPSRWNGSGVDALPSGPAGDGVRDVRVRAGIVADDRVSVTVSYAVDDCRAASQPPRLSLRRSSGPPAPLLVDPWDVPGMLLSLRAACGTGG